LMPIIYISTGAIVIWLIFISTMRMLKKA